MNKGLSKIFFIVPCLLLFGASHAQLIVSNTGNYASKPYLVQNVLVGTGISVSNVTYNGAPNAIGFFKNGNTTNIGIDSGVIMTSGDIINAIGPNNQGWTTTANGITATDNDLFLVSNNGMPVYDKCILEFDFIPTSDTVKFRYAFGSEEYPEYVGSIFNDVFGFFISGPGISGPYSNNSKNIAVLPNGVTPVSINNVNNGSTDCSFGGPTGPCQNCAYYVNNCNGATIQYDGFTTVLTAKQKVTCGQTYHIKLAIADIGDQAFDSGVFLEGGSFKSTGVQVTSVSSGANILGNDSTLYEGCGSLVLTFKRDPNNVSTQDTAFIALSGTATNGTDYPALPNMVIFPVGISTVTIPVTAIMDNISEPTETIIFTITTKGCTQQVPLTITIYINNVDPVTVAVNSPGVCVNDSVTLTSTVNGGLPGYQYQWSNGAGTNSSATVIALNSATYTLTVKDTCGNTTTVNVPLNIQAPNASFNISYPTANSGEFHNTSTGGVTYLWDFGDGGPTSTVFNPTHTFPEATDTIQTYLVMLVVTSSMGCTDTAWEVVQIMPDFYFYTPNSFTPNGDGLNDVYTAVGRGVKSYQMMIFDRWGQMIYKTDNMAKGWTGALDGKLVQEDVYIAVFDAENFEGRKFHKVTHVSLIK